jgi:hypothetical protein
MDQDVAVDDEVATEDQPQSEGDPNPQPVYVETAFVVFIDDHGHWRVTPDVHATAEWTFGRSALVDDMFSAVCTIKKDIEVEQAGSQAGAAMAATMKLMAEQIAMQKLQQAAGVPGAGAAGAVDLSRLRG